MYSSLSQLPMDCTAAQNSHSTKRYDMPSPIPLNVPLFSHHYLQHAHYCQPARGQHITSCISLTLLLYQGNFPLPVAAPLQPLYTSLEWYARARARARFGPKDTYLSVLTSSLCSECNEHLARGCLFFIADD